MARHGVEVLVVIASESHVELGSFADIEIDADATEHGRLPLDERKIDGLDVDLVLVVEAVINAGLNKRTYHGPAIIPTREESGGHHSREFFELSVGKANPAEADMVVGPRRQVIEPSPKIDPRARPCGNDRASIDRRDKTGGIEISMTTAKAVLDLRSAELAGRDGETVNRAIGEEGEAAGRTVIQCRVAGIAEAESAKRRIGVEIDVRIRVIAEGAKRQEIGWKIEGTRGIYAKPQRHAGIETVETKRPAQARSAGLYLEPIMRGVRHAGNAETRYGRTEGAQHRPRSACSDQAIQNDGRQREVGDLAAGAGARRGGGIGDRLLRRGWLDRQRFEELTTARRQRGRTAASRNGVCDRTRQDELIENRKHARRQQGSDGVVQCAGDAVE